MRPNTDQAAPLPDTTNALDRQDSGNGKRAQKPLTRSGALLVRLLLIGLVLGLGWYTLTSFTELLSGPQPARPLNSILQEPNQFPSLTQSLQGLPAPGPWIFAGQPWQVSIRQITEVARHEYLLKPPVSSIPEGRVSDGERGLLHLIRLMGGRHVQQGQDKLYRLTQPEFEAVLFTRQRGNEERVVAGRMVLPDGPGTWKLVEMLPRATPLAVAHRESASLMPLPDDAQCLAKRLDDQGTILCELVSVNREWAHVQELWRENGWVVQSGPGSTMPGSPWFCQRGPEAVQAWTRIADPKSRRLVMMLIRLTPPGKRT